MPDFVFAIDGSYQEVSVETGYPGAHVGYLTTASVVLDLAAIDRLDETRPVDPKAFRSTEKTAAVDAALPGSNVVTRTHHSAKMAFREELYEVLHGEAMGSQEGVTLLDTYEALLALKPSTRDPTCPYSEFGCDKTVPITPGLTTCTCTERRPIWSTDALRIHERFRDTGTNGEAFGEVMQVWERILLIHLLRAIERRGLLAQIHRVAFFVDGPLAIFGHPAWLSTAIKTELQRLNEQARRASGQDLTIIGIEKTGPFVTHFEELDKTDQPGQQRFGPRSYFLPTDPYIKDRIIFSDSPKRYAKDTYFGRKFFYKTQSGARLVAVVPFLDHLQDSLDTDNISLYPSFGAICLLLDKLVSSRYPNAVVPLVAAHAQAAIPFSLGGKVLEQLATMLMRKP